MESFVDKLIWKGNGMPGFLIGEFFIPWYGFMIAIGILIGGSIGCLLVKAKGQSVIEFILVALYLLLFGFIGAKLLYLWVARNQIQWSRLVEKTYRDSLIKGGFVFYGGLLGGLASFYFVKRIHKINVLSYLKTTIACIPMIHGFGRIGCYLAGCCYGIPYNGICSVTYQNAVAAPLGIPLFPVQLVEGLCNLSLGVGMTLYVWKTKKTEWNLYFYLISYGTIRFLLEFLRYDRVERGMFGLFSTSQWISILLVTVTIGFCFYHKKTDIVPK